LEKPFCKHLAERNPLGLDLDVGDRGSIYSGGQKQSICLARALLRKSKVIIMDEATSSIDRDTDALLQQSLRTCTSGVTVITIAHRLETILMYDRVLVMAEGRIIENGNPIELALKKDGEFSDMCCTAGIDIEEYSK
jgi:ABC-type multidrug transport system fused ATPase/permease subunit